MFNVLLVLLGLSIACMTPSVSGANQQTIRVATYNLHFDSRPDDISVEDTLGNLTDPIQRPSEFYGIQGEQPWSTRRIKVFQQIVNEGIVIVGLQEALTRQVNDLAGLLGSDQWAWVGVGRDDGKTSGEYSAVFYKTTIIDLREFDFFWLSDTPDEAGSKYNDAGSPSVCTAVRFSHRSQQGIIPFTYLNTHLDARSDEQRRLGASMLRARAHYEAYGAGSGTTPIPVLVTGDLNSPATGNASGAYQILTGQSDPVTIDTGFADKYKLPEGAPTDFRLLDLATVVPRVAVSGDWATYTGFSAPGNASEYERVDFVFGGDNNKINATAYHVATSLSDDGVLASDHRPVIVDVVLSS